MHQKYSKIRQRKRKAQYIDKNFDGFLIFAYLCNQQQLCQANLKPISI